MKDLIPVTDIERTIFELRGVQVMIDSDLATMYGTQTKKLKQQVKRNAARFPEDFMFELTKEEKEHLIETTPRLSNLRFSPVLPMAFTEHGVMMLSSVLGSETAVAVNIEVMRVFSRMRKALSTHGDLLLKLEKLGATVSHHSRDIKLIFAQLRRMREEEQNRLHLEQIARERRKRTPIGFRLGKKKR